MDSLGLFNANSRTWIYTGIKPSSTDVYSFHTWRKPKNFSFCSILCIGPGGCGGSGTVAAAGAAGGGGGGASGSQTLVVIPFDFLPDTLYLDVPLGQNIAPVALFNATRVSVHQDYSASLATGVAGYGPRNVLCFADYGRNGSNATAGTGGSGGTAGAAAIGADMRMGWSFLRSSIAGQAGTAGGNAVAGTALTLPVTGLRVTGGTGGGGLPASASSVAGGAFTVPAAPSVFPPHTGGAASTGATVPPGVGSNGCLIRNAGMYWYGGTGGASTWGTASGAGLVQGVGGIGGIGCGGGGSGGALTASTAAPKSFGGSGCVIITVW